MKAKVEVSLQLPGIVCVCHVILGLAQSMIFGGGGNVRFRGNSGLKSGDMENYLKKQQ